MAGRSSGSRTLFIVLGIIGGLMVLGCLGIVGIVGLGYWGLSVVTDQAMAALNDNPVVQQRVGRITELDVDWTGTGLEEGENVFVFEFTSAKATGVVTAAFITIDLETEKVVSGKLELSSGETYDLFPEEEVSPEEADD